MGDRRRKLVQVDAQLRPTAAVLLRDRARTYQRLAEKSEVPAEAAILYAMSTVLSEVGTVLAESKSEGVA